MQKSDHSKSDLEAFKTAHFDLCSGLVDDAIDTLQELTCRSPKNSAYWYLLGTAYGKADRHEESRQAYARAQHNRTCRSGPLHELANAFIQAGDQDNAKLALKHLYQLRPDLVEGFEMPLK